MRYSVVYTTEELMGIKLEHLRLEIHCLYA